MTCALHNFRDDVCQVISNCFLSSEGYCERSSATIIWRCTLIIFALELYTAHKVANNACIICIRASLKACKKNSMQTKLANEFDWLCEKWLNDEKRNFVPSDQWKT